MNQKSKLLLQKIKEDINQTLDLGIGHDDPNHISNYIHRHCKHPIFYVHGFYQKPNYFKNELNAKKVTEENCDYCLLQCLECGNFLGIDKPNYPKKDWFHQYKGSSIRVIQTQKSYEETRLLYLTNISKSNKDEVNTAKEFKKKYQNQKD